MLAFVSNKKHTEISDLKIISGGKSNQILEAYYISNNKHQRVWEYISGYVYFEDGLCPRFTDELVEKFEDQ